MTGLIDNQKIKVRALPRLKLIVGILARHKFLDTLLGRGLWPPQRMCERRWRNWQSCFSSLGRYWQCGATYYRPPKLMNWKCRTTNYA